MNTPNPEKDSDLILYLNRACLGEIRPNMRQISIKFIKKEKKVILYVYYDKPLTQEELDYDVIGTILAEVISDFPQNLEWKEEVIVLPYPAKIPHNGVCVYARYEPSPDIE
jgi:hypothetical protein